MLELKFYAKRKKRKKRKNIITFLNKNGAVTNNLNISCLKLLDAPTMPFFFSYKK